MAESTANAENKSVRTALFLFAKISGWIAVPVVAALLLGKWLDKKWGTAPFLFLALTGVAFIVSLVGIIRESRKAMAEIEEEVKARKDSAQN